jgi:hypothetical protein
MQTPRPQNVILERESRDRAVWQLRRQRRSVPPADTPHHFSPTSVQFKSEINRALPCKRHQTQRLAIFTAFLRTRRSGVRIPPGAPLSPSLSFSYKPPFLPLTLPQRLCLAKTPYTRKMNELAQGSIRTFPI